MVSHINRFFHITIDFFSFFYYQTKKKTKIIKYLLFRSKSLVRFFILTYCDHRKNININNEKKREKNLGVINNVRPTTTTTKTDNPKGTRWILFIFFFSEYLFYFTLI